MGKIQDAIAVAKSTGETDRLKKAVTKLPSRPVPNPMSNDNAGPTHPVESFDDVTAAWHAGDLNDDQYSDAVEAATGTPYKLPKADSDTDEPEDDSDNIT